MKSNLNLNNINSFAVYYGSNSIEKLSNSDLVIVEPLGQSEGNIEYLKRKGTIVIAYISVLEISKDSPEYKYLREEDFLKLNEEKVVNEAFDNYLVDLRSKRWNAMIIQKIGDFLLNKNYDGIFLDTIGDIEFDIIPSMTKDFLTNALVNLLVEIRKLFKDCIIIQNNGIAELIKYTGTLIDGVIWENSSLDIFDSSNSKSKLLKYINLLRDKYNIQIFLLFDAAYISKNSKSYDAINGISKKGDILVHVAGENYLEL